MKQPLRCFLAAGMCVGSAAVVSAGELCTEKTLLGTFAASAVGFNGKDQKYAPTAFAVVEFYDGKGHNVYVEKYSDNTEQSLKGTYRVNKNCRAEVLYENGRTNTLFITPNGKEMAFVVTGGPIIASTARWVSGENLVGKTPF